MNGGSMFTEAGNVIHYYTLKAMVEGSGEANNSYAIVEVRADNSLTVTGYRNAAGKEMAAK